MDSIQNGVNRQSDFSNQAHTLLSEAEQREQDYQRLLSERGVLLNQLIDPALAKTMKKVQPASFARPQSMTREIKPQVVQRPKSWLDWDGLNEFANGSMAVCFGEEFKVFEGRRHPRIPRGVLMLMSRIERVQGQRHALKEAAEIFAAYDVPDSTWFNSPDNREIAVSALMEIALQPCGVLSAHLGTALTRPDVDFYFRNLDGEITLKEVGALSGKTIQSWGKLTSTILSASTILQRFDFSLAVSGQVFLTGNTVFGYFPPDAMASQNGFPGAVPLPLDVSTATSLPVSGIAEHFGPQRVLMLDEAYVLLKQGPQADEELLGRYAIHAEDWFFQDHFYQDPVMPGSLGVEAVYQLLELYTLSLPETKAMSRVELLPGADQKIAWKYRGQILPTDTMMTVRVKVQKEISANGELRLHAEAEVWKDQIKIYEVNPLSLRIHAA